MTFPSNIRQKVAEAIEEVEPLLGDHCFIEDYEGMADAALKAIEPEVRELAAAYQWALNFVPKGKTIPFDHNLLALFEHKEEK